MSILKLLLLGIVIASNNLAVSFALGSLETKKYHTRVVIIFGFFEFFVPLIGLLIGKHFSQYISEYASSIGGIILGVLGLIAIYNGLKKDKGMQGLVKKIVSYKGLITLAMGLSLDNLIIGFGLGLKDINPFILAGVISFCSVLFSWIGLKTGHYLRKQDRKATKISAGILLILLGLAVYYEVI